MKGAFPFVVIALSGAVAEAQSVVPVRAIRAEHVLTAADVAISPDRWPGALSDAAEAIGREARVALYPGRPIAAGDLADPAVVERNQPVRLHYAADVLSISVDGRALGRGRPGEVIQVMNTTSRATLFGTVQPDGSIVVSP